MAEGSIVPMRPADVLRQVVLEELDVTPDGAIAIVTRRAIQRGRYVGHLCAISLRRRTQSTRLTSGNVMDRSPCVSPDGLSIAFVRSDPKDDDAPSTLCTVAVGGGDVHQIAPRSTRRGFGTITEVAWSPDGRRLAFTAEVDPPRSIVGDHPGAGAKTSASPLARHITRADWRWDGEGHRDHWSHLFVVELRGKAAPQQVTRGDWGVSGVTWHPSGTSIAFVADRGACADIRPRTSIWSVDIGAANAEPIEILHAPGGASRPAFSPNGRWLAAVGVASTDPTDDISPELLLGPADGHRPPSGLSPELDRPVGNWADTDLNGWMVTNPTGPAWLDDSTIVAVVTDRGRSLPERWVIDPVTGEPLVVPAPSRRDAPDPWADATSEALAVARGSGTVVVLGTLDARAMEVMTVDLGAPVRRFRTHSTDGSAWHRRLALPEMRRVEAPGPGGSIETWIASPIGSGSSTLPTIVDVHGGPLGCWAPAPSIEVILLTGAGYRVVLPNVRGSASYGADWIRPQLGDWGGVDATDVHAALDHVVALGLADPNYLGALGLSYGGFMVNWLVATSDRFTAAVSENGVTNNVAAWANSDSGPDYSRSAHLGDTLTSDGVDRLWRQSPLRHVANVNTPLLMLQAEDDLRCPPQDNEQFFVALRHLQRTVEYVLYPEESHVYATTGRPDRRVDRMTRVLDWFDRYL